MAGAPDVLQYGSLVELLDDAAARWPGDRIMYSLRTDQGIELAWTVAEMRRRSLLAAWRLRAIGLQPGDRLLTWSPSTPRLPAVYWAAMRADIVVVPLDLRMTPGVIDRISTRADTRWLAIDSGLDAPDPLEVGLDHFEVLKLEDLTADPDGSFPDDWEDRIAAWPAPTAHSLFEVVFTSGTTADPKGVLLTHGNVLETIALFSHLIDGRHQRAVSILPLSHLFEQAPVLFYGTSIGAEVLYVRSRNPRVIFEALREFRVTAMVLTPQILELFWSALTREIERTGQTRRFERARRIAGHLPYRLRRLIFRQLHAQLGGELRLFVSAGAYLPPELQGAWEDVGITVMQGYGSTECGIVTANDVWRHPAGVVGRVRPPVQVRLHPETSEILVNGPTVSPGYWRDDATTAASRDAEGWFVTGDVGHFTDQGDLVLSGRLRNIIVLPNGLNVYPGGRRGRAERPWHRPVGRPGDRAGAHRGGGPAAGQPPGRARRPGRAGCPVAGGEGDAARGDRRHHQGCQRRSRATPAHRRLAPLAGARFPEHPHAEDPPQQGARVGRRRDRPSRS